jgi:hypothetical protein
MLNLNDLLGKDREDLDLSLHQRIFVFLYFFMNLVTLRVWTSYTERVCLGTIPLCESIEEKKMTLV